MISPAEFERARLAFVAGWEAADVARPSAPPGTRSGEGLAAALDSLGIIVADDSPAKPVAAWRQPPMLDIQGGIDG